jgi:hypothetical protein
MADIEELVRKLGDPYPTTRLSAAWALEDAARHGADISAAIPALAKSLYHGDMSVQGNAASALKSATANVKSRDAALSALLEALYHTGRLSRISIDRALDGAIAKCASAEALDWIEGRFRGEYDALRKECWRQRGPELSRTGLLVSRLFNQAAKRRDVLTSDKGILLNDMPKPPKKGGREIYQQVRGMRNGRA